MRTTTTAAAALVVACLLGSSAGAQPEPEPAAPTVHHVGAFSLAVPATWQAKPVSGDTAFRADGPATDSDPPDTVDVVVRWLPSNVTDARGCEATAKWVMRAFLHINYTTLSEAPMTIGGRPAYAHTYTWTAKTGLPRWSTQACVVDRGRAYVLTGTTADTPHAAPARAGVIMAILNSFRLTAPQR